MYPRKSVLIILVLFGTLPQTTLAQEEESNRVEFTLDARARLETVETNNALLDATALTARIRAGLITPNWQGLDAVAELEAVEAFGSEDFNSGSNRRTQFATILDPEDIEINQLALRYRQAHHYVQLGRQRMTLDNQRFFGAVGYRQNQQTYDALSYMNTALQGQQIRYAYMTRARRFLSDEHPIGEIEMNSHLLNYALQRLNGDTFSAYAYLVDMDTPQVVQNSSKTFGLRYSGTSATEVGDFLYTIEFATQSDYANGAATNDADYLSVELGLKLANEWVVKLGQERLGGDGVYGFQTPFGTNHGFNGYADLFAARTPDNGLIDTHVKLVAPVWGTRIQLAVHDFAADTGGPDHGTELDIQIEKRFAERFAVNLLFADYHADNLAVDTSKWALWIDFRY